MDVSSIFNKFKNKLRFNGLAVSTAQALNTHIIHIKIVQTHEISNTEFWFKKSSPIAKENNRNLILLLLGIIAKILFLLF